VTQQLRNGSAGAPPAGSNLRNIAQGCVPINPFGTGPLDQAAHDYSFGFLDEETTVKQTVLAFNTTGDLAAGFGAGSIKGAVGVEFRTEKGENLGLQGGKPDYIRTDYLIQYGESFAGKVDVVEGYFETNLPLLRDLPGAQRLELDLSGRYSSYTNKGTLGPGDGIKRTNDMFTWKVSGIWDPVDALRVRFSQSRDSRAANFRELYYGQIIQAGGAFGFCTPAGLPPTAIPDACTWSLEGNVDLKPEKADTTTIGLVFTPRDVLPGFEFAADYFRIKVTSAIQQASVARVREGCQLSHIQEFCDLLTPDVGALPTPGTNGNYSYNPATGAGLLRLRATAFNGSAYLYRGIDFSGAFTHRLGDADTVSFRLLATRMLEQSFTPVPGQPTIDVIGQTGNANSFLSDNQPSAKWNANLSATWMHGNFSTTLNTRYIGKGVQNYQGVDARDDNYFSAPSNWVRLDDNTVGSYTVFGLNANYRWENKGFAKTLDLWGNISNLLDRTPPIVGGGQGGTNAVFFDTLGRYYKIGLRASF
jgi:outer membrane receptor protein involved in Fe transport